MQQISGERLQDHWSSGYSVSGQSELKNKFKVSFVVCDNGFSQMSYNCSNVE